jgi:catechol 2,3-dioxygenase-like lactoylglutathione lyase family enzyme
MTEDVGPIGTIDLAAITFYTADLDAAIDWYGAKLGLTPMSVGKDGHPFAVFRLGGSIVVLEPIEAALEPTPPGHESATINLVVKRNADAIRADLIANGVSCGEIVSSPNFRSFLIRDLDGNRFYIAQTASAPTG